MSERMALAEIRNHLGRKPRDEKTYGRKRKITVENQNLHGDLFGRDENDIENGFQKLTIDQQNEADSRPPACPRNLKVPVAKPNYQRRRQPSRKAAKPNMMLSLSAEQTKVLQPLLSYSEKGVQDFEEFGNQIARKFVCTKLGEGSYAEAFKLKPRDASKVEVVSSYGGLIVKIIPFALNSPTNADLSTSVDSVVREVRIMHSLASLHGFAQFRGLHVVRGKWPQDLVEAFRQYKIAEREYAINREPSKQYPTDQFYAIIEMDDAGSEIAKLKNLSVFQIFDIFWMTTIFLANAEDKLQFEHRDLHLSNICFKRYNESTRPDISTSSLITMERYPESRLGLSNLRITIIDYTLARAQLSDDCDNIAYDRIAHGSHLVSGAADLETRLQINVYKKMRKHALMIEEDMRRTATEWGLPCKAVHKYSRFLPKTNIFWLGFLLRALTGRSSKDDSGFSLGSNQMAKNLQDNMWKCLAEANEHINNKDSTLSPQGATDLLRDAVDKGWLGENEIEAYKRQLEQET